MRPIWTGTISFVLVNIPVRLYSASRAEGIDFDLLHKDDHSNIRYARICKIEEKEVPYSDLVRGYEITKDNYVILTDEDFEKADVKKSKSIEIVTFTDEKDIDSVYYEKPYFLEPDRGGEKSYAIFREALKNSKKIAVGKFVLKEREHLATLKPDGNVIVLNQLRYADEIKDPSGLNISEEIIGKNELELAVSLIERLEKPFNPKGYKDTYIETLMKLIEGKAKGKKVLAKGKAPEATRFEDLMKELKKSLEEVDKAYTK